MQGRNNFLGKFIGQHSEIGARFILGTCFNMCVCGDIQIDTHLDQGWIQLL